MDFNVKLKAAVYLRSWPIAGYDMDSRVDCPWHNRPCDFAKGPLQYTVSEAEISCGKGTVRAGTFNFL